MAKVLLSGGAGFLGSHLAKAFLDRGDSVVAVDNLSTGRRENIAELEQHPQFMYVQADITQPLPAQITSKKYDIVANLASPASPPTYLKLSIETLMVGALGTKNMLDIALRDNARFLQASTSEVYGDPEQHPQPETYWGNVNSYGARAMYDESKRFAEALIWVYKHQKKANTCMVRIFNTYGPHMDPADGRVVSNFIVQALKNEPITIYGEGRQTRSFCYVSDQVAGMLKLVDSDEEGPINIGNPSEFTMLELAEKVIAKTGSTSKIVHQPLPPDDPTQRKPDITLAKKALGWEPKVALSEGLEPTIAYFRTQL
jgi:nucleoside-diphosphate-sugar epimerase